MDRDSWILPCKSQAMKMETSYEAADDEVNESRGLCKICKINQTLNASETGGNSYLDTSNNKTEYQQ